MNIGITGASGFIGSRIVELVNERGHRVIGFSRNPNRLIRNCAETRVFSPDRSVDVSGCDALIHLAGENIFGIWTKEKKRRIRESRVRGTRRIIESILAGPHPPRVLVSGSAIGFYGDTGESIADESAPAGDGFLAEVTQAWEAEALRARERGVRVVLLRTGVVLGKNGGALRVMSPIFRAGLGGKIGDGTQWMSWIHLDDEAALTLFAIENETVSGPLNAVAPEPVRNVDFTRDVARTLHRPAIFTVSAFVLKTIAGEPSRELLDSKRIVPRAATAAGFRFHFPNLTDALAALFPIENPKS